MKWILLLASGLVMTAQERRVAITIDDLPFAHSGPRACEPDRLREQTKKLMGHLKAGSVAATGFVVGGNCPQLTADERRAVLGEWRAAGATLGNHTYAHRSLTVTPIAEYEQDILKEDPEVRALAGGRPVRWFRSPMLHTGATPAVRERLEAFLKQHGYEQAPVTFDNCDWLFANVYAAALERGDEATLKRVRAEYVPYLESTVEFFEKQARQITGRDISHILLLHANRLNADFLPDVLAMFRRRGYRFVTLDEAMTDAAYQLPNTYAGRNGISIIRRWAMSQGLPDAVEPADPAWLSEYLKR